MLKKKQIFWVYDGLADAICVRGERELLDKREICDYNNLLFLTSFEMKRCSAVAHIHTGELAIYVLHIRELLIVNVYLSIAVGQMNHCRWEEGEKRKEKRWFARLIVLCSTMQVNSGIMKSCGGIIVEKVVLPESPGLGVHQLRNGTIEKGDGCA